MRLKRLPQFFFGLVLATAAGTSQAGPELFDYGFNLDGDISVPTFGDAVPASVDISGFDDFTGLGSIAVTITGVGGHSFDFFLDLEIDEGVNGFTNESGAANGVAAPGQSWEIDDPFLGDIFDNFEASTYDNTNGVPAGSEDDVALGLGWDFVLAVNEAAFLSLLVSEIQPTSDFFLSHTDADSDLIVFLSGSLEIRTDTPGTVPAPATGLLIGVGLIVLARIRRC